MAFRKIAWRAGMAVPLLIGCDHPAHLLAAPIAGEPKSSDSRRVKTTGEVFLGNWPLVILGMMLSVLTTTTFYLITLTRRHLAARALHLAATTNLVVTLCVGSVCSGCRSVARFQTSSPAAASAAHSCLTLLTAYPAMAWLVSDPASLLLFELWFRSSSVYNGAMIPFLAELMPAEVRQQRFPWRSVWRRRSSVVLRLRCNLPDQVTGNSAAPALGSRSRPRSACRQHVQAVGRRASSI